MSQKIYPVYIADGFPDDCEVLIDKCLKTEVLTYRAFCEIWKDMKFAKVFQGRTTGAETAELSEELIFVAKRYMVANAANIEECIAGLFLVYALINLQPFPNFAAVRLVPDEMVALKRIEQVARRDSRHDVLYVLGAVLIRGPCQFHIDERERGMEKAVRKYLQGPKSVYKSSRRKGVFYRQGNILDIFKELDTVNRQYNSTKELLNDKPTVDPSLSYVKDKTPNELFASLTKFIHGENSHNKDADAENADDYNPSDHYNNVQTIKYKAMNQTVKSLTHLTDLSERNQTSTSPKKQSPTKNAGSPSKAKSGSPTKTVAPNLKRKKSTEDDNVTKTPKQKLMKPDEVVNVAMNVNEFMKLFKQEDVVCKREIDEDTKPLSTLNTSSANYRVGVLTEVGKDKKLALYKVLKKKERKNEKPSTQKSTKCVLENDPETLGNNESTASTNNDAKGNDSNSKDTQVTPIEDDILKEAQKLEQNLAPKMKRDMKRTRIKTKFQRQGMLPVANFTESKPVD